MTSMPDKQNRNLVHFVTNLGIVEKEPSQVIE